MKPRFHSHSVALGSLLSAPDVSTPHEQSPPIHWCSGSSPLVLPHALWPRFEVQVGSISLSCGLPQLEKATRLPNKDTDQCPSRLQCRSMPRVGFPIWTERNPCIFPVSPAAAGPCQPREHMGPMCHPSTLPFQP